MLDPYDLVQGGLGNLVGLSTTPFQQGFNVFLLSPSQGSWEFSVIDSFATVFGGSNTLLGAYRGDVYFASGYCGLYCNSLSGGVSVLRLPIKGFSGLWSTDDMFFPDGQLGVDANRNVYGTTQGCGKYGLGTVWRVTH